MPAMLTTFMKYHMIQHFMDEVLTGDDIYYMAIGRVTPFTDDNSPPTPPDTVRNIYYDTWKDFIAFKRIQASDVSSVARRYNWRSGTVYREYNDANTSLYPTSTDTTSNTTFFVITEDNNVYKCIDNGRGRPSTVKPTGTSTSITNTSDGYRWKFMLKISAAQALKFMTTNYIPVKTLTANDGSAQWSVQQAAANGAINHIRITANGINYLSTSNTLSSISNTTVVVLSSDASGTDNVYNGSTIYISAGLGAGQLRRIVDYVGSTRTLTVNGAFTTTPNTSSRYVIGPNVIIKGDSGASAPLRATAYVSNCGGGQIRKISMVAVGLGYSYANVTISANSSWGSGATAVAVMSPFGGHGANPAKELGASGLMFSTQLIGNQSNTFPSNNDFRTISIVRDPKLRAGPSANVSVIDQCTRLTVTGLSGDLTADEVITGATSGAKARFVWFANTNAARTSGVVRVIHVSTDGNGNGFRAGEVITGGTTGKTASISSVAKPALREFSGDILYTENRSPISRINNQVEEIKILIQY